MRAATAIVRLVIVVQFLHCIALTVVPILEQTTQDSETEDLSLLLDNIERDDSISDVLVLVCTQSFTAEDLVEDMLLDVLDGWSVQVALVDEAPGIDWSNSESSDQETLSLVDSARALLVVASTYADGDPPNHAMEFADWLTRTSCTNEIPPFAVFGLGDSSYAQYCKFGEHVDQRLDALGGERLVQFQTGDARGDQSGQFQQWAEQVSQALSRKLPRRRIETSSGVPRKPFASTGADTIRSALEPESITATFVGNENLLHNNNTRSVLHVSVSLPSNNLEPGDYLGVYPQNSPQVVERALRWLNIDGNILTRIRHRDKTEQTVTARELLTRHVDLTGRATRSTLRALLPFVGTLDLRALGRKLTRVETSSEADFEAWLAGRRWTKLDLAIYFECRPSLLAFSRALGPMQPRLYSVATVSSNIVGLCMAVVEGGLCSNYVANLDAGSGITLFVRKTKFHFVNDDKPAVLVAAGSGIGPYMGFLEQSEISLTHVRLFYGSRTPDEILYADLLSSFEYQGAHMHYAFSRLFGSPRLHAQDVLRASGVTVWKDIFMDLGRVFVCGRLELCTDVRNALVEIAQVEGGLTENEARDAVKMLEREERLLTDCWSIEPTPPQSKVEQCEIETTTEKPVQNELLVDISSIPEWPSYLRLAASGELERRIEKATEMYSSCVSCGRFCEVDRHSTDPKDWGECRVGARAIVSAVDAHFGEEDCLKGTHGSGTIFFGACNLKCTYCQNWQLSIMDQGDVVDDARLAQFMLDLQERGCHNINLVSPTHNLLTILKATLIAAQNGLRLPIVWNTGGYDSVAALRLLEDVIDIYMPDSKYASRAVARKLSRIDNYPEINQAAIKEMYRQVGDLQIDPRTGLAFRGVLVRHLVLPSDLAGTNDVADFLVQEVSIDTYTHVMPYYRPEHEARHDTKWGLARKPTPNEIRQAYKAAKCARLYRLHGEAKGAVVPEECTNPATRDEQ